jgi:spermidine synthase
VSPPARLLPLLAGLFFLSGVSALIYQSLWLRLLSLVFGVTIYAASTVLASFMAGLALGTLAAGRLTRRVRSPLRWFAAAELGVGLAALATPWALEAGSHVWIALQARLPDQLWIVTIARFACALAVLLVPTVLMGATLPLVVRSSLVENDLVGPRVGVLYATNTAGAIAGALLAGFVLIGGIGIQRSFLLAAALNGLVALVAMLLAWRREPASAPAPATAAAARGTHPLGLAVFAISGFAALALEVVWFRVIVLVAAATTYAFTTMLATVLLGLAAGSALATPWLRRPWNWVRTYGIAQIVTGLMAVGAMALYLRGYGGGWLRGSDYVASLYVIFLPALAMGFAFPAGIRAWTDAHGPAHRESAAQVATLYAANVAGAIGGALAGGFLLLPALGSRASVGLLSACFVLSGLVLVWRGSAGTPARRTDHAGRIGGWRAPLAATALVLAAFVWLYAIVPSPLAAIQERRVPEGDTPLFVEEGLQTTVAVFARRSGGRVLYLDSLHQADDTAEMTDIHRQIGLLPAAIHPAPRRALVVGLGGGVTPGVLSLVDGLAIDIVELSESAVRGAEQFRHVNEDVLTQPNVRLRVDDGRNYLLTTAERYDIITADTIQPIYAGAGYLYSAEYFRLARRALAPGGVMLQWVGIRPVNQYELIVRTFLEVFPHATAWVDGTLLVGAAEPLTLDPAAFTARLQQDGTRAAFARAGLVDFDALLALYTAGPEQLRAFVGPGPTLTDDRPLVEYHRSLRGGGQDVDTSGLRGDPARLIRRTSPIRP